MNKNGYCLLSLIVACWALLGCYQRPNTDQYATDDIEEEKEEFYREGIYALPGDYELEHHTDLTAYFDSLCHEGLFENHNNHFLTVIYREKIHPIQKQKSAKHWKS